MRSTPRPFGRRLAAGLVSPLAGAPSSFYGMRMTTAQRPLRTRLYLSSIQITASMGCKAAPGTIITPCSNRLRQVSVCLVSTMLAIRTFRSSPICFGAGNTGNSRAVRSDAVSHRGHSTALLERPARSWIYCQAVRPEREPRPADHSSASREIAARSPPRPKWST